MTKDASKTQYIKCDSCESPAIYIRTSGERESRMGRCREHYPTDTGRTPSPEAITKDPGDRVGVRACDFMGDFDAMAKLLEVMDVRGPRMPK